MMFDSGIHAMSWFMNESESLDNPSCITGSILNMLRSGTSGGGSCVSEDDKYNARIDICCMLKNLEPREVLLLKLIVENGVRGAIGHVRTSPDWSDWRKKNERGIINQTVLYSECVYEVLDKFEKLLYEGEYIPYCTGCVK